MTILRAAAFALLLGASLAFTAWTWRRLWRRGHCPWSRVVYCGGIRGWGLLTWLALSAWTPLSLSDAAPAAAVRDPEFWLRAGAGALLAFPLALWAGYAWGRVLAAAFRIPRPTLDS